jgi:hypothetical protein
MALAVIIEAPNERPSRGRYEGSLPGSEHVCAFETAAIYWFLYALFETVQEHKGKDLDRHGWCSFVGAELPALAATLVAAQTAIAAQPNAWTVVTDDAGAPGEERDASVQNQELQAVLNQIVPAIHTTEARNTYLSFVNN